MNPGCFCNQERRLSIGCFLKRRTIGGVNLIVPSITPTHTVIRLVENQCQVNAC